MGTEVAEAVEDDEAAEEKRKGRRKSEQIYFSIISS